MLPMKGQRPLVARRASSSFSLTIREAAASYPSKDTWLERRRPYGRLRRQRRSGSNLPVLAPVTNMYHERSEYRIIGPLRSVESRIRICPLTGATSTQAPLFTLRLAFRH